MPTLGEVLVKEIEAAWAQPQEDWARKRLLVVRLIAQHELRTDQIAKVAGVSRKSVFNYRDLVVSGGVTALLKRDWAGGPTPVVRGAVAEEFIQRLEAGQFRQVREAKAWTKKRTRKALSASGAPKVLRRLGGKLKMPRKSHAKKDPAKAAKFKTELPARLSEVVGPAPAQPVRLWVLDEHRYGLLPVIPRVWARRGVRVQCALRHAISMGLSARGAGGRRGVRHRTTVHSGHRPRYPCALPQADCRLRSEGAACDYRRSSRFPSVDR